jgi:valyl-tRNA synthetase
MCGYNALWIPGMDHAGIATQVRTLSQLGLKKISLQNKHVQYVLVLH